VVERPTIIGTVAGQPVAGLADFDHVAQRGHRYAVRAELGGVLITCDHDSIIFGTSDELPLEQWAAIRELVLMPEDPIGQLIDLARRWVDHAE
jgi:hypothetical protein